jgi:hypothetical protein
MRGCLDTESPMWRGDGIEQFEVCQPQGMVKGVAMAPEASVTLTEAVQISSGPVE